MKRSYLPHELDPKSPLAQALAALSEQTTILVLDGDVLRPSAKPEVVFRRSPADAFAWEHDANGLRVVLHVGKEFGRGVFVARLGDDVTCGAYRAEAGW